MESKVDIINTAGEKSLLDFVPRTKEPSRYLDVASKIYHLSTTAPILLRDFSQRDKETKLIYSAAVEISMGDLYMTAESLRLEITNGVVFYDKQPVPQIGGQGLEGAAVGTHRRVYLLPNGRILKLQARSLTDNRPFSYECSDNGTELLVQKMLYRPLANDMPQIDAWGVLEDGGKSVDFILEQSVVPLATVIADEEINRQIKRDISTGYLEEVETYPPEINAVIRGILELINRGWAQRIRDFSISNLGQADNRRVVVMDAGYLREQYAIPTVLMEAMRDVCAKIHEDHKKS